MTWNYVFNKLVPPSNNHEKFWFYTWIKQLGIAVTFKRINFYFTPEFIDDFKGDRRYLVRSNLLNIRFETWQWSFTSLVVPPIKYFSKYNFFYWSMAMQGYWAK